MGDPRGQGWGAVGTCQSPQRPPLPEGSCDHADRQHLAPVGVITMSHLLASLTQNFLGRKQGRNMYAGV